jgi:uncharacterized membrane protein
MKIEWRREAWHLAVIGAMFAAAAAAWPAAPDRLPVHWNLQGEVDRYGGKFEGLLLVPLMTFGLYWLLLLLPFIDPKRENYARFKGAYCVIRWCLTAFMAALFGLMLAAAFGRSVDIAFGLSLLMAALFMVLGFSLENVQPNWFVGVRTPWTLSSPLSWAKTHRAAKWVFVALGLVFLPLGWWKSAWALAALFVVGGGGLGWLLVYSYWVWKRDPDRAPSSDALPRGSQP